MSKAPAYLIDGSGYIFRAYYAIRPLSTRAGVPTNAVIGFAKMLNKLIKDVKPELLAIAFDAREKTFRHDMFTNYKANRDAPPEDLAPQFALIHELVACLNIPCLITPGFEADDIIATLVHQAKQDGRESVVVSADKDLMQLVQDGTKMYDPMKDRDFGPEQVKEKFGVYPNRLLDVLALAGDSSDNIPGVPKVGPKSAAKLIEQYGSLEAAIDGVQKLDKPKAFERSLAEHQEQARLSYRLVALSTDAPVSFDPTEFHYNGPDTDKLRNFLQKIEAHNLIREFGLAETDPEGQTPVAPAVAQDTIDPDAFETIAKAEQLRAWLADPPALLAPELFFDQQNPKMIYGLALATYGKRSIYIPCDHRLIGSVNVRLETVLDILKIVLEDEGVKKVGYDLKATATVLLEFGIELSGVTHDALLAAHILDPSRASFALEALAREELDHDAKKLGDLLGSGKSKRTFCDVPVEEAARFGTERVAIALRVAQSLGGKVQDAGQNALYREIELPLIRPLSHMEHAGICVDVDGLLALQQDLAVELQDVERQANALVDEPFNLGSPKQLAEVLFDKLKLPAAKKTKTGFSTDHEVLETLSLQTPGVVLQHRLLSKLKSTYVDALPKLARGAHRRVHTTYNQVGAATGRLSSSDPNLQNIPIRTETGRKIRALFVPRPRWKLISADYSQIELRLMAHFSGDPSFVEAFQKGEDIHVRTAREILSGGQDPTPEQRRSAKAINFGILYGLGEFGLSRNLKIPRAEAKEYRDKYFAQYPGIREFLDKTISLARRRGFVMTLGGRRRFLPELTSRNKSLVNAAERIAMNTPIQGSAADLMKMAMIHASEAIAAAKLESTILLQVHDELVLEAPAPEVEEVSALVSRCMSQVLRLRVPLTVEVGVGDNWNEAH